MLNLYSYLKALDLMVGGYLTEKGVLKARLLLAIDIIGWFYIESYE